MIFIQQFGELGSSDIDQAGGKAANLGELTRAGLPVPPGFVVLTEAYRAYIAEHQLEDHIIALAAASEDPAGYDDASAQISARRRRTGGGPLLGDCRRSPRGELRRPAGHVPQCARPG
jgi:phosphoenolpyruvate synthase/pyruvate phosphate dikinase